MKASFTRVFPQEGLSNGTHVILRVFYVKGRGYYVKTELAYDVVTTPMEEEDLNKLLSIAEEAETDEDREGVLEVIEYMRNTIFSYRANLTCHEVSLLEKASRYSEAKFKACIKAMKNNMAELVDTFVNNHGVRV